MDRCPEKAFWQQSPADIVRLILACFVYSGYGYALIRAVQPDRDLDVVLRKGGLPC